MANFFQQVGITSANEVTQATPSSGGFSILTIVLIFLAIVVVGVIVFMIYYNKIKKKVFKYNIALYKDLNGEPYFVNGDKARELKIKGTNVRVFYWQKSKFYSAYPTREMGNNLFAYKINRFGELSNFSLKSSEKETDAQMEFDHRDQTYAYLGLQDLINKNYRDKNQKWWKENIGLIVVIIAGVLLGIEIWFFFNQSGHQVSQWANIAQTMKEAASQMAQATQNMKSLNSGIISGA